MKSTLFIFLCSLFMLCACSVAKESRNSDSKPTKDPNNVVIVNSKNALNFGSSNDKVIFKGENNIVEINNEGATFNSKNSNDVMIIEGNQNVVSVNQAGVTDTSEDSHDTTYINGNRMRKEFIAKDVLDAQILHRKSDGLTVTNSNISKQIIQQDDDDEPFFFAADELIFVPELDSLITIGEAIDFYNSETLKRNMEAYYKLGTFYQFGVGTKRNIPKALEYFEIAARNNHVTAQYTLGTIYKNGIMGVPPNAEKANYYFKLAAKNGEKR
ncbi:MAG: sel1 repeat family protein [Crocinitomicaceae bacterium]|nr:sel1 repeat family protein [Crocinitomicaceae bacterium]